MPKILFGVSSSYCANFLKGQLIHWANKGFEVVVISGPGTEIQELCKRENAKLYEIAFTKKITPFKDLLQTIRIYNILKKETPDIINAGNPKSGLLIMLAARMTNKGYRIFTLHGLYSDGQQGLKRWFITKGEKLSVKYAEKIIVVSESLKAHAIKRCIIPAEKAVVPANGSFNGINLRRFSPTAKANDTADAMRKNFGISEADFVIGYVGRLTKDKGIDYLLDAFNILRIKHRHIKLLVAGPEVPENPIAEKTLEQIKKDPSIIYPGKVDDIISVYNLLHVLVLPSLREGFPGVLLEAAAMQLPVVCSNIPGCIDAVQPNVTGLLFSAGDVDELVEALERLISSKPLRHQLGMNGRKFVEDAFSNEVVWQAHEALYKEALAHLQ